MPTDLYEQLAAELGLSPAEAEEALRNLLRDVKDRARSGEEVSLEKLGTFSMEEGTLSFTPDPVIEKAVNYRHDHLAPLTVGDAPEETTSEEAPPPPEPEPEPSVEPDEFIPSEESEPEAVETPEEAVVAETPTGEPDDVADLSEDWTEELDEGGPPSQQHSSTEDLGQSEDSAPDTAQMVGLVAAIVFLVVLIWFVLGSQGIVTGPGALFQSAPTPAATTADTVASAPTSDTAEANAPPADTAGMQPATEPPPTIDRAEGGWTIVVASRIDPNEAKSLFEAYQQRFQGAGLPVDILTGTSGGQTRYRVTVGQYTTQQAAVTALEQLQDRLPDDAWPLRVQPNS